MRGRVLGVLALVTGLALPVAGQVQKTEFERCGGTELPVRNLTKIEVPSLTMQYAISIERLQLDGSTKTTGYTQVDAFDSQGRWMNSKTADSSPEVESPITIFCVYDPVAGVKTTWSVPGKQATQMKIAEIESSRAACAQDKKPDTGVPHSKPVVENLGTDTIQGYEAQGFRTSRSIPIRANGSGKTTIRSVEIWRAPVPGLDFLWGLEMTDSYRIDDPWYWSESEKLENFGPRQAEYFTAEGGRTGLLVRGIVDDRQMGKRSEELQDFHLGDPDPAVFQPPAEYIIVSKQVPVACSGAVAAVPAGTHPAPAQ